MLLERKFTRWSFLLAISVFILLGSWFWNITTHKTLSVSDYVFWVSIAVSLFISIFVYNRIANQSRNLIDNNKKFLTFFNFSPTCICIEEIDTGIILDANQAFLDLFGYKRKEAIGHSFTSLGIISGQNRGKIINELRVQGSLKNKEQIMFPKTGNPIDVLFSNIIIELDGTKCSLTLLNDISEKKELETQLILAKERAEKAVKVREEFLANMSHEIRTPMNGVIGMAYLLSQTTLSKEQDEYAKSIRDSAGMLLTIINDILDISKINADRMIFESTPFDVRDIIRNLSLAMEAKSSEKNIHYSSQIENNIPARVIGDPVRLSQILWNLTGNAVKFTEKGEVSIEVKSKGEENGNIILEFLVKDTGIGINPGKLLSIFEPFTQANMDIGRRFGGTGLGLGIAKKLVERQNGTISVESKVGKGSVFTARLPFRKYAEEASVSTESFRGTAHLKNLTGAKILVVEDDKISQRVAFKTLSNWGATVGLAENGRIAVEMLTDQVYDLVLMDIQMPEMDGFQATRYIRSKLSPPASNIPIIAITASVLRLDYEKCLALGMSEYIPKPFKPDELYDKIVRLLSAQKTEKRNPAPQEM